MEVYGYYAHAWSLLDGTFHFPFHNGTLAYTYVVAYCKNYVSIYNYLCILGS